MAYERSGLRVPGAICIGLAVSGLLLVWLQNRSYEPVGIVGLFMPGCSIGLIVFGVGLLVMRREPRSWNAMSPREEYIEDVGNGPRVASWASIVCFCTGAIPLVLLIVYWIYTPIPKRSHGEMGDFGWFFMLGFLSLQAFALSGLGIGLAIWAACKSRWLWGKLGIILNAALPVLCVLAWLSVGFIRDFYPGD